MNGKLFVVHCTDPTVLIRPITAPPSHEDLSDFVDGTPEKISRFNTIQTGGDVLRCIAYGNSEGRGVRNLLATKEWYNARVRANQPFPDDGTGPHLVGNIVIVIGDDELLDLL